MTYTEDKQPSGLSVLTDLANDDTVIVGDTSDVNEVVKTISWTNLKTAISTYVEGLASYFNVTTGTTDDITEGATNKFVSTANVDAAGAVMNTDTTTAAMSFVIDEDTMVSDLATKVPTQQSVKAYVDANAGSVSDTAYGVGWDAVTGVAPSKNAVYDKIETLQVKPAEGAFVDGDKTKLDGIATSATANPNAIDNVVEDTTPQLGGTLDMNSQVVQGDIVPSADSTYDLGSSAVKWAEVHSDAIHSINWIAQGGPEELVLKDSSANKIAQFEGVGTPANNLYLLNAATGNGPEIRATGTDTNISIELIPKGSGEVQVNGQKVIDETNTATTSAAGIVELATTAETNTGTDTARAVTPDALADSKFGTSSLVSSIQFVIDGGGSAITTGVKGYLEVPFACTINQVTLLADQSGSIVVDIWKDSYANYPPTDADSITASAVPTISTATKSQDATLTGWTTSISAGDILGFNVDSITTCERVTLSLKVTRT